MAAHNSPSQRIFRPPVPAEPANLWSPVTNLSPHLAPSNGGTAAPRYLPRAYTHGEHRPSAFSNSGDGGYGSGALGRASSYGRQQLDAYGSPFSPPPQRSDSGAPPTTFDESSVDGLYRMNQKAVITYGSMESRVFTAGGMGGGTATGSVASVASTISPRRPLPSTRMNRLCGIVHVSPVLLVLTLSQFSCHLAALILDQRAQRPRAFVSAAMAGNRVVQEWQLYRIVTSVFVPGGWTSFITTFLLNVVYIGMGLEKMLGSSRTLLFTLAPGLFASLLVSLLHPCTYFSSAPVAFAAVGGYEIVGNFLARLRGHRASCFRSLPSVIAVLWLCCLSFIDRGRTNLFVILLTVVLGGCLSVWLCMSIAPRKKYYRAAFVISSVIILLTVGTAVGLLFWQLTGGGTTCAVHGPKLS